MPLQAQRLAQNEKLLSYQNSAIDDDLVDLGIMQLFRKQVIGVQAIAHILKAFDEPPHDWGDRTIWRLFNATTFTIAGKVAEAPQLTQGVHTVMDDLAEYARLIN